MSKNLCKNSRERERERELKAPSKNRFLDISSVKITVLVFCAVD